MSEPQKPKREFSGEMRILVASLLSMVVILLWIKFFAPKPPVTPPQTNRAVQTAPAATNPAMPGTSPAKPAGNESAGQSPAARATALSAPTTATIPPEADKHERTLTVESDLYRVVISNRGGVVKSWELKKYMDDAKPPKVLDVVHSKASEQVGGWPFALVLDDPQMEASANSGLYVAEVSEPGAKTGSAKAHEVPAGPLKAPVELNLTWSDGHLEATKKLRFDNSYVMHVESSVKLNGASVRAGVAWLGGFGDLTVTNPGPVDTVTTFYSENGSLTRLPHKKLEGPEKWGPGIWQGGKDYAGIQDTYFAATFLPIQGAPSGTIETRYWKVSHTVQVEGKDEQEPVAEIATSSSAQPLALRVFVGPKDYDLLKKMNPPMQALVNFGWLEIIADPLFHGLKWIHNYVPNWGWSIVVLTLVINMLLFPLKISGYRTTLKMQRVAPEIKQINDRYKKYKMNDPKKQEMNKEVMAVYSREGINPVGGCIPQLLQLPIWYGLYRALQGTIELRHAPWFGWITDLSAKDPYYILPILMGVSMYFASKMTPMTTTDPQQQAMMKFMPIGMSGLFLIIPYPSGLAVYILTSGVVGIAQQWYLNRKHPPVAPAKPARGKKS